MCFIKASKLQNIFQKLVAQNTQTDNLEFIIPNEIKNLNFEEYLNIIQTINDVPNAKGHIFDIIRQNHCADYPDIIGKINEFVAAILNKFNTFFNDNVSRLVTLLDNYDYVNLVK
ncbi:MAG: hypothetical protein O7C68_04060 [Rickettsia endosymbiont of Ixodes ricinus]|uniref:Uncharacterized protein n=2 Tax=Rickettsia helvetica TaxID=35789 RepID=A0ABM9NDU5_RICHE|nr:hypothetical protein [Rickettsia helvetica]MCZ6884242.1 hypothetical protein [Rickettsia endosymbiont of Ixodes ricinus]MCZ6902619.1 hypothetical protein [Rickettsia endosymbiont of Ixodes persulcatus]MCZ6896764.1 hypothetical protein [Rickettsia endosymbiont of Ixodes ricinus]MCZ6903381.1 hypothetical protein [Rickettsia endosymbiont of Ixodes persulcatus]MCZ6908913.1 hypothetical protein [Rickettsia endosymbiont of Ixodes persulcatus]